MARRRVIIYLGTGVGFGILIYFFAVLDWQAFLRTLRGIRAAALLPVIAFILAASVCRSLRWEALLRGGVPPENRPVFLKRLWLCWQALCIGYFGNMVFPARAGEMIRMFQIHKSLDVNLGSAVAMSVLDRLLDVCCVLILGLCLAFTVLAGVPSVRTALIPLTLILLVLLILGVLLFRCGDWTQRVDTIVLSRLPVVIRGKAKAFLEQVALAVRGAGSPVLLMRAFLFSACAFFMDVMACWQIMRAFGWQLPFEAALSMELSLCVAGSLPSAPAYLGLYQAAAVFVLGHYGGTQADGVVYALILQMLTLLLYTVIGGSSFFSLWKTVNKRGE
ncbi:MAG: flippase-like domain-containing protein [Desulfovibrio sp.]|jgi:uncharacterized protein (TIRG00374 family)|nr:flippase-like domain-containing protein [Desulfovibrio sp.]